MQILRHPWYSKGLPAGVIEMNDTCLSLQQDSAAMQTDEEIRSVVQAAKIPSRFAGPVRDDEDSQIEDEESMIDAEEGPSLDGTKDPYRNTRLLPQRR